MDDAPPDSEDDSSISDDEILYRRIAHYGSGDLVAVDAITGHRRPSSGAFKSDNDGISVYLDGVLFEVALGPQDLVVRRRTQSSRSEPPYLGSYPSMSFVTQGRPAPTIMTTRETPRTP